MYVRVVQQLVVIVLRAPGGEFRPDAIREHGFDVVDNVSRGVNTLTRALERARGEDEAVDVVQVGVGDEETAAEPNVSDRRDSCACARAPTGSTSRRRTLRDRRWIGRLAHRHRHHRKGWDSAP